MSIRKFATCMFIIAIGLLSTGLFFCFKEKSMIVTDKSKDNEFQLSTVENSSYQDRIKKEFNIDVKYNGIEDYTIHDNKVVLLTEDIDRYIQELYLDLSLYPTNYFREITNKMPLTIYLVKSIGETAITGATDTTNIKDVIMTVTTDFNIENTLHHEVYHYTEDFMILNGLDLKDWNKTYNNNFKYGNTNEKLIYGFNNDCSTAAFVMDYSQTDEYEDRATVFETLMYSDNSIACYKDKNSILWKKANRMAEEMDKYLGSVTSANEYWERFIYE